MYLNYPQQTVENPTADTEESKWDRIRQQREMLL
jgi:hypothetical protein